jgi:hypothetical protein
MTETPSQTINYSAEFRRASNVFLFLGILSVWTSQLHTVLLYGTFEYVQFDGAFFMLCYFWGAYWTRRGSVTAFLFASVAFTISMLLGFRTSIMNAELMDSLMGEGAFWRITGGNLVYVLIIYFFLIRCYKSLPRTVE